MRSVSILLLLALVSATACASGACSVNTAEEAGAVGAAALQLENPAGPNVHVEDRGNHWVVGEWIDDLSTDDEVLLGAGGRSVEVAKCSGRLSGRRSWR